MHNEQTVRWYRALKATEEKEEEDEVRCATSQDAVNPGHKG
jgi:hypothetical protein